MNNLIDYIEWRGDISFDKSPLNNVDLCVFTQMMMNLDFLNEEMTIEEANHKYHEIGKEEKIGLIISDDCIKLFDLASASIRFKDIKIIRYYNNVLEKESVDDTKTQLQFGAITFKLPIKKPYYVIMFKGTDDTIAGWAENLHYLRTGHIPADDLAISYVNEHIKTHKGKFSICGHSKGGHLAINTPLYISKEAYRALDIAVSFDGYGVEKLENKRRFKKVINYIPEDSFIGLLFNHYEKQIVMKSSSKGFYEHDAFSWEIKGCNFVCGVLSDNAKIIDNSTKQITSAMTDFEKEMFGKVFENMMLNSGIHNLLELKQDEKKKKLLSYYLTMNRKERLYFSRPIAKLGKSKAMTLFFIGSVKEVRQRIKYEKRNKTTK